MTSPASAEEPLAVVELFTSQGCSSCPPADAFLGELSVRHDVLALAYHVDYWDYIGWKDIYANPAYTQRQRAYARRFDLSYIYTPQMVVNGHFETSGNKRRALLQVIEQEIRAASQITLAVRGGQIVLDGPQQDQAVALYQVTYLKEEKTKIRRGENRGKTLSEYNIVTELAELSEWRGGSLVLDLPENLSPKEYGKALFLQRKGDFKILGALKL